MQSPPPSLWASGDNILPQSCDVIVYCCEINYSNLSDIKQNNIASHFQGFSSEITWYLLKLQKWHRELLYIIHQTSLNVNLLYNHNIINELKTNSDTIILLFLGVMVLVADWTELVGSHSESFMWLRRHW